MNSQNSSTQISTEAPELPQFGRRATDRLLAAALMKGLPLMREEDMPKVLADERNKALKDAAKKAAAKGITKPKHEPQPQAEAESTEAGAVAGVDSPEAAVVQSGFSVFNQQEKSMTETPNIVDPEKAAKQAEREAEAAAKAEAKAAKAAEREAKAKQAEADKLVKTAEREAKAKERAEAAAAAAAAAKEAGRTYTGSMLALADRVKQGVYVKSALGQLRSTDELATALDAVPPAGVVTLGKLIFAGETKYDSLNIGQQSMNFRNRLRGAIRKGIEVEIAGVKQKVTLDFVKQLVADHKLAVDVVAEKKAKEEAKAKAAAEKKAKEEAAAAEKAAKAAKANEKVPASEAKQEEAQPA